METHFFYHDKAKQAKSKEEYSCGDGLREEQTEEVGHRQGDGPAASHTLRDPLEQPVRIQRAEGKSNEIYIW